MEKNVFVFQSTTMETELNGDTRDASHDDPRCTGNHNGEDIYGEGEEGCQQIIQLEQSQWTSEAHKLMQHPEIYCSPPSWSSWSHFYLSGVKNEWPRSELFKRVDQLHLRDKNVDAYTHKMFSLGPFNAKPDVSEQDRLKLSAVCKLFGDSPEVFQQLVQAMKKRLPLFKSLYNEDFSQWEGGTLALLFAVDAVCIVAGLVWKVDAFQHRSIASDVILVENQIPVLAISYAIQSINTAQGNIAELQPRLCHIEPLQLIVVSLLKMFSPFPHKQVQEESADVLKKDLIGDRPLLGFLYDTLTRGSFSSSDEYYECSHFDKLQNDINAEEDRGYKKKEGPYSMPGACSLEKHRLKFEGLKEADFTRIHFVEAAGTLKLPKIHEMNECRQRFLLNLVAYEQNIAGSSNYKPVTSYVGMMGALMKGEKDVEVLLRSGVLVELNGQNINAKKVQAELWQKIVSSLELLPHTRTKADAKVEEGVRDFTDRKLNKARAFIVSLWP
ncbi:hypothetical protein GOP47_0003386 [Adiantum capillus-veneris]|uniref:Uncharacterized protein n=2 Tax=Adiantum capillus-veneris TaxID=13818 RepID=A0A9D4VDP0_ADICA|nr:hypothetical protein GOP47_0003386 [Adiantum capillus-veneris]